MSKHQALGLSVQVYKPSFAPYVPKASFLGTLSTPDSYEHVLTVGVGYDTMQVSKSISRDKGDWWLVNGCGAHVEVIDETASIVWEGRVDSVSLSVGGYTEQRGPLSEIANRCTVTYQLLDTDTNESQEQKRTDAANNTDSQAKYGIQHAILSAGSVTTAQANQIRDTYVMARGWPAVAKQLSLGGGAVTITLSCKGYYHWLNYPYRLANVTGTVGISTKIAAVLAADPNSFFGGANQIASNTFAVQYLEDQDRSAAEIIADLVALGDASYGRMLFGMWEGRAVRYEAAPTQAVYQQRVTDPRQVIEDMSSNVIQPWAVRPGNWVLLTSMLPGALMGISTAGGEETERSMFIESVRFGSPYGLDLTSGTVNNYRQALAQWGITGV